MSNYLKFQELLAKHTIDVGPLSYVKRLDLAIIAHSCNEEVRIVASKALYLEMLHGWYDTYELCNILHLYGYLDDATATQLVFCSNSFALWRMRAAECPLIFDLDPFWKAGESRIVSKSIDVVKTPSVFTAG